MAAQGPETSHSNAPDGPPSPRDALALDELSTLLERERAARARAEELNRIKDAFLATFSHELRAPTNAILGWARLLRSGALDEGRATHALETIERNAAIQVRFVEELLDVARIVTGKLRCNDEPVDLGRCLEAAVEACRPDAEAKGVALATYVDSELPLIRGDDDRLQQVFWNLVANAVKFTPPGGSVRVTATREELRVRVEVRDTGEGIASDFLPHVFERFTQAESGPARGHHGLGLGLAIVRQLVELHRGSVTAASPGPGAGAVFAVELPSTPAA